MPIRGIRGAINLKRNSKEEIQKGTQALLRAMISENKIKTETIAAAFFTATPDLMSDFPAYAARDLGWTDVPMMCNQELNVRGGMKRVIRILLLLNTPLSQKEIRHQYLGETHCLRPDLAKNSKPPTRKKNSRRNRSSTPRSAKEKR